MAAEMGGPLPPGDEHAVSVCIPTWADTLAWARREPDLLAQLKAGYPRFFVPLRVEELSGKLLRWVAAGQNCNATQGRMPLETSVVEKLALLFPSEHMAQEGLQHLTVHNREAISIVHVTWDGQVRFVDGCHSTPRPTGIGHVYALIYPRQLATEGKAFWQHTGYGISSRYAAFWLDNAPFLHGAGTPHSYNLVMLQKEANEATAIIRNRISSLLSSKANEVGIEAVQIYHTGMSAISHVATALRSLKGGGQKRCQVVVFGFLYVDTYKVLSKVHGFDCRLYGYLAPSDLHILETDLTEGLQIDALFTEFPGNPLLASVDLDRLYRLSRKYNFVLVVDDTVATWANANVLLSCDVVCTSLTKMFSGGCNVMGGSVVLNQQSHIYESMQKALMGRFVDTYFPQDILTMKSNSADFTSRAITASKNAEHLVEMIRRHTTVEKVFYPKGSSTQSIYDRFRLDSGGYGYLFSIQFLRPAAAVAFHDAFHVAKGPSLGTNFSLCSAYTLYAHYCELDWAAKFGVVEHLVRVSVGIESEHILVGLVQRALDAAAEASMDDVL